MRQGVAVTSAVVAAAKIVERNPAGYEARSARLGVRSNRRRAEAPSLASTGKRSSPSSAMVASDSLIHAEKKGLTASPSCPLPG